MQTGSISKGIYALKVSVCQPHAEIHLHTHLCLICTTVVFSILSLPIYMLITVQGSPDPSRTQIQDCHTKFNFTTVSILVYNLKIKVKKKTHSKNKISKTNKQIK